MITRSLFFIDHSIDGIRYAYDLPTPVPASNTPTAFALNDSLILSTSLSWLGRSSYWSDVRARGPSLERYAAVSSGTSFSIATGFIGSITAYTLVTSLFIM